MTEKRDRRGDSTTSERPYRRLWPADDHGADGGTSSSQRGSKTDGDIANANTTDEGRRRTMALKIDAKMPPVSTPSDLSAERIDAGGFPTTWSVPPWRGMPEFR